MENNQQSSVFRIRRGWLAGLFTVGIFALGLLLGRTWLARPSAAPAAPVPAEEKAAERKGAPAAANQVRLSAEAIQRGQIADGDVATHAFTQSLEVPGRLAVNEDNLARVGTFVKGRVTRVLATVGDTVRKGQALVYLHSHELVDARGDAQKAHAKVTEKEKALAYARAEFERAERLLEAKAISRREQAQAAANVAAASAELDHAKAELTRADEFLEHLTVPHDSHDDIVIYAPIGGVVLKRNVTLGTVVGESDDLMTLANLDSLWAIAEVPQQHAAGIHPGLPIAMKISTFGETTFAGRVVRLGEQLNPETRTVQVRCLVQNPRGSLRPEMFATIRISAPGGAGASHATAVPKDAVQDLQGERVAFVPLGNGVFEKRPVETGREQDGMIEILKGLQPGQRVVTRGGFFIKTEFLRNTMNEE